MQFLFPVKILNPFFKLFTISKIVYIKILFSKYSGQNLVKLRSKPDDSQNYHA